MCLVRGRNNWYEDPPENEKVETPIACTLRFLDNANGEITSEEIASQSGQKKEDVDHHLSIMCKEGYARRGEGGFITCAMGKRVAARKRKREKKHQ